MKQKIATHRPKLKKHRVIKALVISPKELEQALNYLSQSIKPGISWEDYLARPHTHESNA